MAIHRVRRFATAVLLIVPLLIAAQPGPAVPADVRKACDEALAIVARTAGANARRSTGAFTDEAFRAPVPGCAIIIEGSFKKAAKSGAAAENLRQAYESRHWLELPEFSADGHDGTSFAFRKDDVACFARGTWNGGADNEPEIPAADPYRVFLVCGRAAAFVRPQ